MTIRNVVGYLVLGSLCFAAGVLLVLAASEPALTPPEPIEACPQCACVATWPAPCPRYVRWAP